MIEVHENVELSRFEICVDSVLAGFTHYEVSSDHWLFDHTEVDPQFEGQGLASQLIEQTLDLMRDRDISVYPYCPFIRTFIKRHPDYLDLVPLEVREKFGLPS